MEDEGDVNRKLNSERLPRMNEAGLEKLEACNEVVAMCMVVCMVWGGLHAYTVLKEWS